MEVGPHVHPVMVPKPTLRDDQVTIEVAAIGLNSNNDLTVYDAVLRLFGRHGSHLYIWNECSGVVVAVGSKVSNFKEGDGEREEKLRLCKTMGSEVCINHKKEDFRKRVKAETGGKVLSEATPGKRILIHGATCGVGVIALQYAKHVGCKVFAVAEEKLLLCKILGADVCINYKKQDFRERVMAETGGKDLFPVSTIYFERDLVPQYRDIGSSTSETKFKHADITFHHMVREPCHIRETSSTNQKSLSSFNYIHLSWKWVVTSDKDVDRAVVYKFLNTRHGGNKITRL